VRWAVVDPLDDAMLLFRDDSAEIPVVVAKVDLYVLNDLVVRWQVKL